MKKYLLLLGISAGVMFLAHSVKAEEPAFSSGSGLELDPYIITNCHQLQSIKEFDVGWQKRYFVLGNDIDCSATSISDPLDPNYDAYLYNDGAGFKTIGYYDFVNNVGYSFTIVLDGNGHSISNVDSHSTCENWPEKCLGGGGTVYNGIFGYGVWEIYNTNFLNIDISGGSDVGAIGFGFAPKLSNITVTGTVRGNYYVGLLLGGAERNAEGYPSTYEINKIKTSGNVYAIGDAGGIVGQLYGGLMISDSYSTANIYGTGWGGNYFGGIVGLCEDVWWSTNKESPKFKNVYFAGTINRETEDDSISIVGGFTGSYANGNVGEFLDSFSVGTILNASTYGSLIGSITGVVDNNLLESSYETTGNCVEGSNEYNCKTGVATDWQNNTDNAPISNWDFTNVWQATAGYPVLKTITFNTPSSPLNVSTQDLLDTSTSIIWDVPTDNGNARMTGYKFYYRQVGETEWTVENVGINAFVISIAGLTATTEYEYKMSAINTVGEGEASAIQTFTTTDSPTPASAPSNVTVTQDPENAMVAIVEWDPPADLGLPAITHYIIEYKAPGEEWPDTPSSYGTVSSSETTATITFDAYGETRDIRVRGLYDASGIYIIGNYSETVRFSITSSPVVHISSCEELQGINDLIDEDANYLYYGYELDNDIDCSDTVNWNNVEGTKLGFEPIRDLRGYFDGKNHKITGLYINRDGEVIDNEVASCTGLFKSIKNATITDLTIEDANIYSSYHNVAAVIGCADWDTVALDNVHVINSSIEGVYYVGGIVGYSETEMLSVDNSSSQGNTINGYEGVGGIVGYADYDVEMYDSYNTSNVVADSIRVGGLIGYGGGIAIQDSYNTGNISGDYRVGGLVGSLGNMIIYNTYNSGTITAEYETDEGYADFKGVGGLVGMGWNGTISQSYNTGLVDGTGRIYVGGLLGGGMEIYIDLSYNSGEVIGNIIDDDYNGVGGLVGSVSSLSVTNSFNDGDLTGNLRTGGIAGFVFLSDLINSYNVGNITLQESSYVGGLVGEVNAVEGLGDTPSLQLENSFNAGQISVLADSDPAGVVGFVDDTTSISNNWWAGAAIYGIGGSEPGDISGVAEKAESSDVFKGNSTNEPLDQWDFDEHWYIRTNNYPVLQWALDETPPVITLVGSSSITLNFGASFTDPGATALDNKDGNITNRIVVNNPVNTNLAGTYTITYNVSDRAGNNATQVTRIVIVRPRIVVVTNIDNEEEETRILLNDFLEYIDGTGKQLPMEVNQVVYFNVGVEEHKATVTQVGEYSVTITIESQPQQLVLGVGETKYVDVDMDGTNDISITLNSILDGIADLTFRQNITPTPSPSATHTPTTAPTSSTVSENNNQAIQLCGIPLAIIAMISVVVIVVIKRKKGNEKNN